MSPRLRPLLLFLLLLALFPAITVVVKALESGLAGLAMWEGFLLAAFPILAWIYLRHFSRLGCREGCSPPDRH